MNRAEIRPVGKFFIKGIAAFQQHLFIMPEMLWASLTFTLGSAVCCLTPCFDQTVCIFIPLLSRRGEVIIFIIYMIDVWQCSLKKQGCCVCTLIKGESLIAVRCTVNWRIFLWSCCFNLYERWFLVNNRNPWLWLQKIRL